MKKQYGKKGRKQAGRVITLLVFLIGFVIGAVAMTSYFWATGQIKGTVYLGAHPPVAPVPHGTPPAASRPAPHATGASPAPALPPSAPPMTTIPPVSPASPAVAGAQPADVQQLMQRHLLIPVAGVKPQELHDSFNDLRGDHRHEAIDLMAPQGTPVLAIDDGVIAKLFTSKQGGLTIYQFDPGQAYSYYYAHLSRYADGLQDGMTVKRGQVIGYVGSTGDADVAAPHLHFAINKLLADKHWWQGTPIDPYPFLAENPPAR